MDPTALSESQVREVQQIAELETRRFFEAYLRDVWPTQLAAIYEYTRTQVKLHDDDDNAHGRVETRFNKMIWLMMGAVGCGGVGAGTALTTLLQTISVG